MNVEKGITFKYTSEAEAENYLANVNNYLRTAAYLKILFMYNSIYPSLTYTRLSSTFSSVRLTITTMLQYIYKQTMKNESFSHCYTKFIFIHDSLIPRIMFLIRLCSDSEKYSNYKTKIIIHLKYTQLKR